MTFDCLLLCDDYLSNEILIKGKEILFGLVNFSWGDQIAATEFFDSSYLLKKSEGRKKSSLFFTGLMRTFVWSLLLNINAAKINPYIFTFMAMSVRQCITCIMHVTVFGVTFLPMQFSGKTKKNVTFWNRKMHWILL